MENGSMVKFRFSFYAISKTMQLYKYYNFSRDRGELAVKLCESFAASMKDITTGSFVWGSSVQSRTKVVVIQAVLQVQDCKIVQLSPEQKYSLYQTCTAHTQKVCNF